MKKKTRKTFEFVTINKLKLGEFSSPSDSKFRKLLSAIQIMRFNIYVWKGNREAPNSKISIH
jgi:hypothetical protein